jgi:hypothetical protein
MDDFDLDSIVSKARQLLNMLSNDERRIEDLAALLKDEAWYANLPQAKPDELARREHSSRATQLNKTINDALGLLESRLSASRERTGT